MGNAVGTGRSTAWITDVLSVPRSKPSYPGAQRWVDCDERQGPRIKAAAATRCLRQPDGERVNWSRISPQSAGLYAGGDQGCDQGAFDLSTGAQCRYHASSSVEFHPVAAPAKRAKTVQLLPQSPRLPPLPMTIPFSGHKAARWRNTLVAIRLQYRSRPTSRAPSRREKT